MSTVLTLTSLLPLRTGIAITTSCLIYAFGLGEGGQLGQATSQHLRGGRGRRILDSGKLGTAPSLYSSSDVCDVHTGADTHLAPSIIETLVGRHSLIAACGRSHTVVFTAKAGGHNPKVTKAQEKELEEHQRKLDLATKARQKRIKGEREKWLDTAKRRRKARQELADEAIKRHQTMKMTGGTGVETTVVNIRKSLYL
jgi:hypothetical protein